jgi:EAL domain-containing protein (putative c-di-GMP-specific phosphodiesterase class I)
LFHTYTKDSELSTAYERNLYWQKRLKTAFKDDAIVPYFQAIANVKTGKIEKYEALVRMVSDGEVVSPFQFLEIAKKTHQYAQMTKVMIAKSFALFANTTLKCSINLSVEDIKNADTMDFLWESIERYALHTRVVLEIVESEGIKNFKEIHPFLEKAHFYGCEISIDDFGTGYSNFNYLIQLQAHTIKIDGSIIKALEDKSSGAADVVEAIVTFAKARGMKTVAEFVATRSLFEKIRSLGIDFAQGYYIAQPLPKEALHLEEV